MWNDAARRAHGLPTIREVVHAAAHRKMERHAAEHAARMRGPVRHPAPERTEAQAADAARGA